ncbi:MULTISPECIES: hypothetical protein [unclassified Polynucleobacter]|uniref:hypothetical protein n=1 Tax=unclassified Polynucleobacter TaxID=2640945 RepID=UPI0025CFEE80|nr:MULTISPECIES: hypothetical protein [unclassified Polynucleobacter]
MAWGGIDAPTQGFSIPCSPTANGRQQSFPDVGLPDKPLSRLVTLLSTPIDFHLKPIEPTRLAADITPLSRQV